MAHNLEDIGCQVGISDKTEVKSLILSMVHIYSLMKIVLD
jgi:hypothetical protein